MQKLQLVPFIIAVVLFFLAAIGVTHSRFNRMAAGFVFLTLALMAGNWK